MRTCLVVDDSSVIRKVARRILEGLDFQILEAEDGSVSFDMRFDNMLERAWSNQLAAVNEKLFG